MTRLSDTQLVILSAAAQRADLSVLPLPDSLTLKGGALNKVMDSLRNRGLIRVLGGDGRPERVVLTVNCPRIASSILLPDRLVASAGMLPGRKLGPVVDGGAAQHGDVARGCGGDPERYGAATRAEKSRILDELVAVAGYHRKHAIRVLCRGEPMVTPHRAHRRRIYGEHDREPLIVLWEASDRICSKWLKPLIPVLLSALERHGRISLAGDARARLLAISAATMDRLLSEVRLIARGGQRRRAGFSSAVRRTVPVRTSATETTRRPATSRSISWRTAARRWPAVSCRRWC